MDINNVNNNINSLNNSVDYQLNKTNESSKIEDKSSDFLRLTINEYNKKRDELSESLQAFNNGIAITKTAEVGLSKQEDILNNIQSKLDSLNKDTQNKNEIKNDINKELLKFKEEAFQTKYKRENLIALDEYEENLVITVSTKEAHYSINKPNTPQIANSLAQEFSRNDFNNEESLNLTKDQVQLAKKEIQGYKEEFSDLSSKLQDSAKDSISQQIDLSKQNMRNKEVNFGKEMNDFSKSNITSNMGYLAASQANIMQEQSVRLLSK